MMMLGYMAAKSSTPTGVPYSPVTGSSTVAPSYRCVRPTLQLASSASPRGPPRVVGFRFGNSSPRGPACRSSRLVLRTSTPRCSTASNSTPVARAISTVPSSADTLSHSSSGSSASLRQYTPSSRRPSGPSFHLGVICVNGRSTLFCASRKCSAHAFSE